VDRHVTLLAILAATSGGLFAVVGISMLLLAAGALAELSDPSGAGLAVAAGVTASAFAIFATFALAWGGVHLWAASLLRHRRPGGRVLMIALGVCNLVLLPFGTALGAYALWVLVSPSSRSLFEAPHTLP
jgi:hypothetical protein